MECLLSAQNKIKKSYIFSPLRCRRQTTDNDDDDDEKEEEISFLLRKMLSSEFSLANKNVISSLLSLI